MSAIGFFSLPSSGVEGNESNMEPLIAIITPSCGRVRFIQPVVRQVRGQDYDNWVFCYVQDGPHPASQQLFLHASGTDPKFHYLESPKNQATMGASARGFGLNYLLTHLPQKPD